MNWMPIESAPKDGTYVLIYTGPEEGLMYAAYWSTLHDDWRSNLETVYGATHWMPLPEPPVGVDHCAGVSNMVEKCVGDASKNLAHRVFGEPKHKCNGHECPTTWASVIPPLVLPDGECQECKPEGDQ